MRWQLAGPLLLLVAALTVAPAVADDLDEQVPAAAGGLLEVDLDLGDGLRPDHGELVIRSHAADAVRIVTEASGWGAWNVRFRLEPASDRVRLVGRVDGALSWLFGGPRIEVRVWVPRRFSLDVRSSAGGIRIEDVVGAVRARTDGAPIDVTGVHGPVRLRNGDGALDVADVAGDVDAKTGSGVVRASDIGGSLVARTGDGEIQVERVEGRCRAKTGSGSIQLDEVVGPVEAKTERGEVFARFAGDAAGSLETRRGAVEVELPPDAGAQLDAEARDGAVELGANVALDGDRAGDRVVGSVGGGGERLRLYSASGQVRVRVR